MLGEAVLVGEVELELELELELLALGVEAGLDGAAVEGAGALDGSFDVLSDEDEESEVVDGEPLDDDSPAEGFILSE